MRIPTLVTLTALGLAACAPTTPARPVSATLLAKELRVTYADGVTCRAQADFAGSVQEGAFATCPHPTRYNVDATARPNPVARVVGEVFTALDLGGALSPHASVTLTDADGRVTVFASPVPAD